MATLESLSQDSRIALRVLTRTPGTTALCVLSVALGIGLTTALFSVADGLVLRPLPVERPGELRSALSRADDGRWVWYGWPDYQDMVQASSGQAEIATYQRRGLLLKTGDETELVLASPTSQNFFSVLGVRPAIGRASYEPIAGRPAAVLGYRIWQRRFGGDPAIVGKTIVLNGKAFAVAGVMQRDFTGLARLVANDVWVSMDAWFDILGNQEEKTSRDAQFEMVARVKPGTNAAALAAKLDAAIRGPGKHKPAPKGAQGTFMESFTPEWAKLLIAGTGFLLVLGLILFTACANAAQLRLAQAETRKKELGVRMALGGSAWRLLRQLLVEAAAVSFAGAALGILMARFAMEKTTEFLTARYTFIDPGIRLDYRVLTFALLAAVATILIAGLAPARHALRVNVTEVLKSEQGATGGRSAWQKKFLIAGQIAVAVLLFGIASIFLQSLWNASATWPGLDPHKKLLVMEVVTESRMAKLAWCSEASERLGALAGVRAVTFARRIPLADSGGGMTARVELPGQAPLGVHLNNVAGNYSKVMGTRLLAGRGVTADDRENSPPVVVISQLLARQLFSGRNPLGERIMVDGKMREVIGISENGPSNDLHETPEPFLYLPFAQAPSDDLTMMVETAGEPGPLTQAARRALKQFDPSVTVLSTTTLRQRMQQALTLDQLLAMITSSLSLFGVLLTAAGLFGVIQYAVNRRTREIGLRMSLGANSADIGKMVLGESLRMAAWGIPIGLLLLAAVAWSVRSLVLGVAPLDPLAYVASALMAVAVCLSAGWLPAQRAARVDPMVALRSE
jgi:putative ABC transport system permease protein